MSRGPRYLSLIFLAGALATPLVTSGCAHRVYDPYYSDYHHWDHRETVYYQQWIVENHRDHHEYAKSNRKEQSQYWNWRHAHSDEHRDHDNH